MLVCDTGPGIPRSKRTLIFKEFQRLEETASTVRGLGLGLSIVERIGKVLDHRIDLQSVLGPRLDVLGRIAAGRARAPAEPAARSLAPSAGRIAGLTVLCIDNEPAVLRGMQALLEGWGCSVITAQERGGGASRGCARAAPGPDIILADYHLDDGTGWRRWRRCAPRQGRRRR